MVNSADPDQLASSEANWSGSSLFEKVGHMRAQQDQGLKLIVFYNYFCIIIHVPITYLQVTE